MLMLAGLFPPPGLSCLFPRQAVILLALGPPAARPKREKPPNPQELPLS
jgi:hypothetical protein